MHHYIKQWPHCTSAPLHDQNFALLHHVLPVQMHHDHYTETLLNPTLANVVVLNCTIEPLYNSTMAPLAKYPLSLYTIAQSKHCTPEHHRMNYTLLEHTIAPLHSYTVTQMYHCTATSLCDHIITPLHY